MSHISKHYSESHPLLPRLGLVASLALAGLGFATASQAQTAPAAATNGMSAICQFKTIPGSGGEGLRYDNCVRQQSCQNMANAEGHMMNSMGCFGVVPDAAASPPARYLSR